MTDRRRVVVTGMGMVTALGNDVPTTWENLVAGRSGIRLIESFDPYSGTFRPYEGNANGMGPNAIKRQGVIRG